jgi:aspartate racemase
MKSVGIIGGIAPESTIDYYRSIIESYRQRSPSGSHPSILINSIDLQRLLNLLSGNRFDEFASWLVSELDVVTRAGVSFAAFASNTPHVVFEEIKRHAKIPIVSIVDAAVAEAVRRGLRKPGLLGTRFTMQGRFYPEAFLREGIELVVPDAGDLDFVHEKYFGELVKGQFLPETRAAILKVIDRMKDRHGIDGVVLAGTELPLLLRDHDPAGLDFLDTTQVHVRAIVDELLR